MTPRDDRFDRRVPRRVQAPAEARMFRSRRFGAFLGLVVLIGAIVGACDVASGASKGTGHGRTKTSGAPPATMPSSFRVGIRTFDWTDTAPGADHVGPTGALVPGRVLTTQVRYPTLAGSGGDENLDAMPAHVGGPYPVIVFAHGFDTDPSSYETLLDAWVAAGFVVVSPIFPDESAQAVSAAGGDTSTKIAAMLETDEFNEPGDIAYVMQQLQNLANLPGGSNLKGVLDLSDVALAGQSDGADVVAALSFASSLKTLYGSLPVAPKAVAVLSGTAWGALGSKPIGSYSASPGSPALLQVQSDADGCVSPTQAVDLFSQLQSGPEQKWFVTLLGADHLGPYEGASPWAPVVAKVTTDFFELELHWRDGGLSAGSITAAGSVGSVAATSESVDEDTMPHVAANGACGIPK